MTNRPRRALLLLLSLLICSLPLSALAEGNLPSAEHLNMTTVAVTDIRYDAGGGETELPMSVEFSIGMDPAARRAMALLNLATGESPLTFMGSIESEEIRARISGVEQGIAMPLEQAEDELIKLTLLMGMEYEDIREETRAALDEYLTLLEESMLVPAEVVESGNLVDAMYPADAWREEYEKYPSLLNAVPAGEEEITLFGTVYTAKKYTYSMERATEEEYNAFYEAYDAHYYGAAGELDQAYSRLMELVIEDYTALMETSDIWTDDGSIEKSESGSLSEWDEAEQYEYFYSMEGVIWLVDEVMGTVEQCTATTHAPDGDYVEEYYYADQLTDNAMRYETTNTGADPYGGASSYTDSMTVQSDETGRILIEGATLTGVDYPDDPDYSYATNLSWRGEMTEDRLLLTVNETTSGSLSSQQVMSMTADFALGQEEETGLINRFSGPFTLNADMLGESFSLSMNIDALLSTLPAGTLLPMSGETINPFDADEETLSQLMTDLEALLMQTFASFIPAPETPSGVGGALLS